MFAEVLAAVLKSWLVVGMVFAAPFLAVGIERIDPATRGAGLGFRLIVLPGVVLLWPVLLWRWIFAGSTDPEGSERNAHLDLVRRRR